MAEVAAGVIGVDVTDRVGVSAAAEETVARSALPRSSSTAPGIAGRSPATDYDPDLFMRVLTVNVLGTFLPCQAFGRSMVEAGRGSIINISSIGGLVGLPGSVGYQASKGAVSQMTRTLAVEWAPSGVRVNAIAPGQTRTPMVEALWARSPSCASSSSRGRRWVASPTPTRWPAPSASSPPISASMITGPDHRDRRRFHRPMRQESGPPAWHTPRATVQALLLRAWAVAIHLEAARGPDVPAGTSAVTDTAPSKSDRMARQPQETWLGLLLDMIRIRRFGRG